MPIYPFLGIKHGDVYCPIIPIFRLNAMVEETILGTSKIDPRYRITLVNPVPELLNVKVGDLVVFIRHKDGTITIKPSQITKVKSGT